MPAASLTRLRGVGDRRRPARLGLAWAEPVHAAGRLARATAHYHDGAPERVTDKNPYVTRFLISVTDLRTCRTPRSLMGPAYRTGRTGDEI